MKPFEERMRSKMERELIRVKKRIAGFRFAEEEEWIEAPWPEERVETLGALLEREGALEEALYRLSRGTFGKCVVCERGIGRHEIEATPEVALCPECRALLEKARPPGSPRRPPGTSSGPLRGLQSPRRWFGTS